MTQVPAQRPSTVPVVPESATTPDSPGGEQEERSAASLLPDYLHNALALAIYQAGVPLDLAGAAADRLGGHVNLLDALVAYRQHERSQFHTREELAGAPTGTIVGTANGLIWLVDHGPGGEWVKGRTHIHELKPDWDRTYYPANFDLSLPVQAWSPRATKGESNAE